MTDIYLHIVARMADYMATHLYYPRGYNKTSAKVAAGYIVQADSGTFLLPTSGLVFDSHI